MEQLIHNGVLIPKYEPEGFRISVRGAEVELTPEQEEMAVAWVRKLGTDYVKDNVFVRNFFKDFSKALGVRARLAPEDIDFSIIKDYIERQRTVKLNLSKDDKKRLREERKASREVRKQKYGYALVDGANMEISNYTAEPSCIFMGRGKHPLRGRWKQGPNEEDIELNLSRDAPRPPGDWKSILWYPDVMWIARWRDKLTSKVRHVWLSENSMLKQRRDIEKFDKALELGRNFRRIKRHIWDNLDADDEKRRKTATVCYLIDNLKVRVGDEKDPDEADTVGASTLRPEHIDFKGDGRVAFNFLGKDSIPHILESELPDKVIRNLKEFSAKGEATLFVGVDSKRVSGFLDEVMVGLSAKVFRTCYASKSVESKLNSTSISNEAPDYIKKYAATTANLEAAKICNHRRTIPKTWSNSLQKKQTRLKERVKKARKYIQMTRKKAQEKETRFKEKLDKQFERINALKKRIETYLEQIAERERQGKPTDTLRRRINTARKTMNLQKERTKNLKAKHAEQIKKLKDRLEKRRSRNKMMIEKARLQIKTQKKTRDYNLGTSLKSYIDPRIYRRWGRQVDYDWKMYYPKALQKKFSWIETEKGEAG